MKSQPKQAEDALDEFADYEELIHREDCGADLFGEDGMTDFDSGQGQHVPSLKVTGIEKLPLESTDQFVRFDKRVIPPGIRDDFLLGADMNDKWGEAWLLWRISLAQFVEEDKVEHVRPSELIDFCKWLLEQEPNGYYFYFHG